MAECWTTRWFCPIGSAVAIQPGRIGISAELFERGHFRMEKPCGEGLMLAGVAALEWLGLNGEKGAPFNGVRDHVGERIAEGRFSEARGAAGNHGAAPFGETGQDNHAHVKDEEQNKKINRKKAGG
jgi:hypothetical protein